MYAMPGPRFMRFAWRIAAYGGMLTRRVEAQADQQDDDTPPPVREQHAAPAASGVGASRLAPEGAKLVSAAELAFMHPGIVEIRKASKASE